LQVRVDCCPAEKLDGRMDFSLPCLRQEIQGLLWRDYVVLCLLPIPRTMIGRITRILIVACVSALAAWTSIAVVIGGPLDSVSAHVRDYSAQYPFIPFALGFVAGHWLWGMGPAVRRDERV
jgi:hypothetical protein